MRVADAVWAATALLHRENPNAEDFEVREIVSRAIRENFVGGFRPGLQPHASWHCVANKRPNGGRYRMLYETVRGRRRLLRPNDRCHPDRNGDIKPEKSALPAAWQTLVDWYDTVYSKPTPPPTSASVGLPGGQALPRQGKSEKSPASESGVSRSMSATAFVSSAGALVIPDDLRRELGIQDGTRLGIYREQGRLVMQPITEEYISSLRGCCKGEDSLVEAREREHRKEK
ncbi:MAG TPA: AbrB/MazE/SpoVT family DNA-binding domain-containing protein [Terriglobales bacterium]|nr:AbrB/MazE/SpoVT family DNA-binding domain-containing protein [Terriglobales bacterium]